MSTRAISIVSRIVFVICGLVSLLTGALFVMLQGEDMPVQSEWIIFAIVLAVIGLCSLLASVLPRSWLAKACKRDRDDARLFSQPLKLLGGFAGVFYLLAIFAHFAPHSWNLNPQLMLSVCPTYLVRMTIDPSPVAIFFLLAPMNAAVYGAVGLTLGYVLLALRRQR